MIENDIKIIKQHKIKTNKILKEISSWQVSHEKSDTEQFRLIQESIAKIPSQEVITDAIAKSIQITVNGKIDKIAAHLTEQDQAMTDFRKQLKPYSTARTWLQETGQVILYLGSICLAIAAVVELLRWMRIFN